VLSGFWVGLLLFCWSELSSDRFSIHFILFRQTATKKVSVEWGSFTSRPCGHHISGNGVPFHKLTHGTIRLMVFTFPLFVSSLSFELITPVLFEMLNNKQTFSHFPLTKDMGQAGFTTCGCLQE
jgi:hypothetical protein